MSPTQGYPGFLAAWFPVQPVPSIGHHHVKGRVMPSQLGPRTSQALDNELRAMRLRIAGQTFDEIATALGYRTRSAAWKAVNRAKTARLVELAGLVQDLALADAWRDLTVMEQRSTSLLGKPLVARCRQVGTLLTQEAWEKGDQAGLHNLIQPRPIRRRRTASHPGDAV